MNASKIFLYNSSVFKKFLYFSFTPPALNLFRFSLPLSRTENHDLTNTDKNRASPGIKLFLLRELNNVSAWLHSFLRKKK